MADIVERLKEIGAMSADQLAARAAYDAAAEIERLNANIDRLTGNSTDHRYWEGRYRDEKAATPAQKRVYENLAKEGGGTWATYMMMDIEAAFSRSETTEGGAHEKRIAELEAALKPFADFIEGTHDSWSDERRIGTLDYDFDKLKLGLFRAARAALTAKPDTDGRVA